MKKLFTILAALAILTPTFMVNAKESNTDFKKGNLVTFKINKDVPDGSSNKLEVQTMVALETPAGQYGKIWSGSSFATGYYASLLNADSSNNKGNSNQEAVTIKTNLKDIAQPMFKLSDDKKNVELNYNGLTLRNAQGSVVSQLAYNYLKSTDDLRLPTRDELVELFGATKSGEEYVIDLTTTQNDNLFHNSNNVGIDYAVVASQLGGLSTRGYYTSTGEVVDGKAYVWVLDMEVTDAMVTKATIKKVENTNTNYMLSFVAEADKSFECNAQPSKSCYKCGEEYVVKEDGDSSVATCTLVTDKDEGTCVTPKNTGEADYLIEGLAIAGIGIAILAVLKRKDLMRNI